MKKAIVSLALALVAAVAFALPTTQDVEAQVRQGNYSQAEAMMNEVVTARPGSARAHYVYAEILAHNRNFVKAADEAQKARQIDPALSFTDPAKFRAFEQLLAREQSGSKGSTSSLDIGPTGMNADRAAPPRGAPPREAPAREATGVPGWMWGLGAVVLAWVAWRAMARRKAAGAAGMAAGPAAAGYGPMNPNPNSPYGPGNAYGPGQPMGPAATPRPHQPARIIKIESSCPDPTATTTPSAIGPSTTNPRIETSTLGARDRLGTVRPNVRVLPRRMRSVASWRRRSTTRC